MWQFIIPYTITEIDCKLCFFLLKTVINLQVWLSQKIRNSSTFVETQSIILQYYVDCTATGQLVETRLCKQTVPVFLCYGISLSNFSGRQAFLSRAEKWYMDLCCSNYWSKDLIQGTVRCVSVLCQCILYSRLQCATLLPQLIISDIVLTASRYVKMDTAQKTDRERLWLKSIIYNLTLDCLFCAENVILLLFANRIISQ